ncbi:MAG: phosphoribosylformylglycinamidine synthase subunit PurQ [Spirochaetota bacterium]
MRIQVTTRASIGDGRAHALVRRLRTAGRHVSAAAVADVYLLHGVPNLTPELARGLFCDAVAQEAQIDGDAVPALEAARDTHRSSEAHATASHATGASAWTLLIEVGYKPGVADPVASSIRDALGSELGELPRDAVVQTARQFFLETHAHPEELARELSNPLIQHARMITRDQWERGERPPARYPTVDAAAVPPVESIDISTLDDTSLEALSSERLLALTLPEMRAIRDYYADPATRSRRSSVGLGPEPTDVELEMLAQTWSEHCKHKIFAARVEYREGDGEPEIIDSLYKTYIQATTKRVADPDFVKSVFDDNAGVVKFDEETLVCIKAETHNSPSALDPYGGAITGIVGVNRDILGTGKGARPIFNTDVLCFGYPDTDPDSLPQGLLHPRVVMEGVHRGIVDGGNQSGIPVAAGAFLFDESYTGKPLVFCGTGGLLPAQVNGEDSWVKHIDAGDVAVMVGGLVGKDGIHGATFSSLALDETSPTSAVQIGEPITQKKMTDFLLEARDLGLYKGITDNGAGGLSSSLGEMARDSGGIRIDLDGAPLKYPGLAAWEILVSESQERMSLAVDPARLDEFLALARRRGVTAAAVGEFTASGLVEITHQGALVGQLTLEFLHDGLPQMVIPAAWPGPGSASVPGDDVDRPASDAPTSGDVNRSASAGAGGGDARRTASDGARAAVVLHDELLALLRDPNVASKEHLVRQYDHEVQGGSVIKPFCGVRADAPSDGAVVRPRLDSFRGLTVTHGICPRRSDRDTYEMAVAAVDEAVRAHVALGGDPDRMAALDNFCWPDPVLSEATPDGPYKMAQLVRACRGLADACSAYSLPLVSGKDSMKNDAKMGGRKVSIRPTLLVTLTGIVPDVRTAMTTDFKRAGDRVLVVGPAAGTPHAGPEPAAPAPAGFTPADLEANLRLYRRLHQAIARGLVNAVHDVSDGGLAVALAECAIGGRLGARIEAGALFAEPLGSLVVTCPPEHLAELTALFDDSPWRDAGEVVIEQVLELVTADRAARWTLDELVRAWDSFAERQGGVSEPRTVSVGETAGGSGDAAGSLGIAGAPRVPSARDLAPRTLLLTGYGINADRELAHAFSIAGAAVEPVHVNDLLSGDAGSRLLADAAILAIPGGFSYGDHVGSGMMLAHRLRALRGALDRFRADGGLTLGICNGFQVLVKLGILPDLGGAWEQEVSLVHNDAGIFEDSWVTVAFSPACDSPWVSGLTRLDVPIRHGEGRFVTADDRILDRLERENRVALRYSGRNPNGSTAGIAGIVDTTGSVLGMMPHPEAFLAPVNHPHRRTREVDADGGIAIFRNAVAAARTRR